MIKLVCFVPCRSAVELAVVVGVVMVMVVVGRSSSTNSDYVEG